jgi:hypothetical protein
MPRKAKRIPRDHREPVDPHLLLKQIELDQRPGTIRIYLLVDELGVECIAKGILPGYVQQQARNAMEWYAVEERKPAHLKSSRGRDSEDDR